DTFFDSEISGNRFEASRLDKGLRRIGITLFRNMGESGKLRKEMPRNNIIKNNTFVGYNCGIIVGARMGRNTRNDVTFEARDYAFSNTLESNNFINCTLGIKVNSDGNTLR